MAEPAMNPCHDCHAGCCRSFAVTVTGADIVRIQHEQSLSFWDFVCRWEDKDGAITRRHAPQFYFDDEPETPFAICLQHTSSSLFPGSTKCQFLKEERSPRTGRVVGGCGVYGSRPSACRIFPTKLSDTGQLAVLYDVPPYGREPEQPAYALCSRPWQPEDLHPTEALQQLVIARFELAFFHQVAAAWNREVFAWREFPAFLDEIYSHRIVHAEGGEFIADMPTIIRLEDGRLARHRAA